MHEAQLHNQSCFITNTYDDKHLPEGNSLNYTDFQLFMKRARRRYSPARVRFYMSGEYGEQFGRPHYHAILFGIDFEDKLYLAKSDAGDRLYTSDTLQQLWPFGQTTIGEVTFKSAAYIARYCFDKITGQPAKLHYEYVDADGVIHQRTPEFNKMSLKPGIGKDWLTQFKSDVYPEGMVVVNGSKTRAPRYYDQWQKKEDPQAYELLQYGRFLEAKTRTADNSPERLAVRETVEKARLSNLKRTIK